jgi:hypothetical protein
LEEQRLAVTAENRRPMKEDYINEHIRKHLGICHRGWYTDFLLLADWQQVAILECSTMQLQTFSLSQLCEIRGLQVRVAVLLTLCCLLIVGISRKWSLLGACMQGVQTVTHPSSSRATWDWHSGAGATTTEQKHSAFAVDGPRHVTSMCVSAVVFVTLEGLSLPKHVNRLALLQCNIRQL